MRQSKTKPEEKYLEIDGALVLHRKCSDPLCENPWKPLNKENFQWRKDHQSYRSDCKKCRVRKNLEWKRNNKDKIKASNKKYVDNNKEKIKINNKIASKKYRENNPEKYRASQQKYAENNPEKRKESIRKYKQNNADKVRKRKRDWERKKRKTDPSFKLRQLVSSEIWRQLKLSGGSKNNQSILSFLPYTLQELRDHLESLFEPWMTWDNWGTYDPKSWDDNDPSTWTWQLDHITPSSLFNYTSMEDAAFQECWALSNLRPYSARQNVIEGATRTRHLQAA